METQGHKVLKICNVKHRTTKQSHSMFFVDLAPCESNKNIYEIKHPLHIKVTTKPTHRKAEISQCSNCQI